VSFIQCRCFALTAGRGWLSCRYGVDNSIPEADVILVLDCDVPWINTRCKPRDDAEIYHVDCDPLKQQMPVFYLNALARYRADSFLAVNQINRYIRSQTELQRELGSASYATRKNALARAHRDFVNGIASQAKPDANGHYQTAHLVSQLRKYCPADTIWCIEAVTQTQIVADHIQATLPGSFVNCGGGGLGWSGGGKISKICRSASNSQSCSGNETGCRDRDEQAICVPDCRRYVRASTQSLG
jgi:thiamine pyrophosphate-dependent acetolactate synthase large subunit-like protein